MKTVIVSMILSLNLLASLPKVSSRSIMSSCAYVYQVESDVRIKSFQTMKDLSLRAKFKNSWDHEPKFSEDFFTTLDDQGIANLTFESMSWAKGFLFREMIFVFGIKNSDGSFSPLSPEYQSDVGREFGEPCYLYRTDDGQFRERNIVEQI